MKSIQLNFNSIPGEIKQDIINKNVDINQLKLCVAKVYIYQLCCSLHRNTCRSQGCGTITKIIPQFLLCCEWWHMALEKRIWTTDHTFFVKGAPVRSGVVRLLHSQPEWISTNILGLIQFPSFYFSYYIVCATLIVKVFIHQLQKQ